jgi:uncharacterized membrane protein
MSKAREAGRAVVTPARVVAGLCLVVPFVAILWVGSYSTVDPAFLGIPFFYWYQLLWVVIACALTAVAYLLWRHDQRSRAAQRHNGGAAR